MTDSQLPAFVTPIDLSFPPAERLGAKVEYYHYLPHEALYQMDVHFVGQAPAQGTINRVLRECLTLAAAHEGRYNIHADAYLLPHADTDPDERQDLHPYGSDHFLCFDASLGRIEVRRMGFNRDGGEDLDDATLDMKENVEEWIWFGYYAADAIFRWIDEGAAEGHGFDLEWIKAFATATLETKRAAETGWPKETDCDRLDNAFGVLNEQGVCALQWAGNSISDGMAEVDAAINDEGVPAGRFKGYCFFHGQDIERVLPEIDRAVQGEGLMLAFGSIESDDDAEHVRIGRMVCKALEEEGMKTSWDGTANHRIAVPGLRWQRRMRG